METIDVRVLVAGLNQTRAAYLGTCPELKSWYDAGVKSEAILQTLLSYVDSCKNDA